MKLVLQVLATVEVMIKVDTEIVMRMLVMMIMGMDMTTTVTDMAENRMNPLGLLPCH